MKSLNYDTDIVKDFANLYEMYYEKVFKYICYRVNEHYMAEELCSQVFEKIMTRYNTFSGNNSNLDSWIFTIAKNTITDYYRKKNKLFNFPLEYISNLISSKNSPDELILTEESNLYLFHALKKLNKKERSVISLRYGAELKSNEIANIMQLSESNVNVIIYRSLRKLKKFLVNGGFKYE